MSRITVCRVCLSSDVKMHNISNLQVQEVFEKITSKKLAEKGRPETICYLCFSVLQKCRKLLDLFIKTENVFEQLSYGGIEITHDTVSSLKKSNMVALLTTPVNHIDILPKNILDNASKVKSIQTSIKEEPKDEDIPVEIEIESMELDNGYDIVFEGDAFNDDYNLDSDDSSKDCTWEIPPKNHSKKKDKNIEQTIKKTKNNTHKQNDTVKEPCAFIKRNKTKHNRNLQTHVKHDAEKLYKCTECDETFTFLNNLQRHEKVHKNTKEYSCELCHKMFSRGDHLQHHMRSHTKEKPYPCNICKMRFSSTSNVQQHINSIHTDEKPFACDQCDKKFSRKGNLQEHSRTHTGDKPYSCGKCAFKCAYLSSFKKHLSEKH